MLGDLSQSVPLLLSLLPSALLSYFALSSSPQIHGQYSAKFEDRIIKLFFWKVSRNM